MVWWGVDGMGFFWHSEVVFYSDLLGVAMKILLIKISNPELLWHIKHNSKKKHNKTRKRERERESVYIFAWKIKSISVTLSKRNFVNHTPNKKKNKKNKK